MPVKRRPAAPVAATGVESRYTRNQLIQELTRSPHGQLSEYVPMGIQASASDPDFYAHLIAWNAKNGEIRDARVALPVISLSSVGFPLMLVGNSIAHMLLLDPRLLVKALSFSRAVRIEPHTRQVMRAVGQYLKVREKNWGWWERAALQHRDSMKALYALSHTKPNAMAQRILFDRDAPRGTVFHELKQLADKSPLQIAGLILKHKIPYLVASGALGPKLKEPDVVLALIGQMSPTEIVTNSGFLSKLGVKENPALRAAYADALAKVAGSKKATFKTTRAAESVKDVQVATKLRQAQEKQLKNLAIDGNWLILGDRSTSMNVSIEAARLVAATLAKLVSGDVHLVFFSDTPTYYPVTGLDYDAIKEKTQHVNADGSTSIGCGLQSIMERGIEVDGIAVVSDAQDNTPPLFPDVYERYVAKLGKAVPVYLYRMACGARSHQDRDLASYMRMKGHDVQEFDLRHGVDYYSLPGLATTMRANRYSLADEIMATPLVTVDEALERRE